jgi:hypothetical protein
MPRFMSANARDRAICRGFMLKPMSEMDLKEGKSGDRKLGSPVWRTYGIFKVDPETAREIADSEDLYYLVE